MTPSCSQLIWGLSKVLQGFAAHGFGGGGGLGFGVHVVPVQVEAQPVVTGMTSSAYPLQPMSMCAYYIYIHK